MGRGRPGWHIECSAMSGALSAKPSTSMAAASISVSPPRERDRADALAPSHDGHGEYLDAQRLPAGGRREDVEDPREFYHHPRAVQTRLGGGTPGRRATLRLRDPPTHYRKPIDSDSEGPLEEGCLSGARGIFGFILLFDDHRDVGDRGESRILDALSDDLNTPKAITEMHRTLERSGVAGARPDADKLGATLSIRRC